MNHSRFILSGALLTLIVGTHLAVAQDSATPDDVIAEQRAALAAATQGKGFGPQAPRDLANTGGANTRVFGTAPPFAEMNLCDIHFHENAEHKGGEFTTYAGNGNGEGAGTGYIYDGDLTDAELTPTDEPIVTGEAGDLEPGDTIEVHYVYTTAEVEPGPTLGSCFNDATVNPQLRVEAQVLVLVNDENALNFNELSQIEDINGRPQAVNIPTDTGTPLTYEGSTTGPAYNEEGSPYKVTWSVRPEVAKVDINSVGVWLGDNVFEEDHAHGVRNLIINPDLLAPMN